MPAALTGRIQRYINKMCPVGHLGVIGDRLGAIGGIEQVGTVFYVDPTSGADTQNGLSPDKAFGTLQTGIDACEANRGDVIVRMRGGEAVTSTVNIDCAGITIIPEGYGMAPLAIGEYFATYSATLTADPVAIVTADGVTIAGMGFAGADAGALFYSGAALLIGGDADATPFGVRIVDCRFPKWGYDNRIGIAVEGSSDCIIEHCSFEGGGADFDSGIYVQGATQNLEISNNRFRDCTYGVLFGSFAGGGPHAIIKSNVFEDSKLVSATAAATGIIADNWSELAVGTGSFSGNYATLAGLGLHCSDNHYLETD